MDHLPEIQASAHTPPSIPCLCNPHSYDRLGITDFPSRAGWEINRTQGPILVDKIRGEIGSSGALVQVWLYFGMLYDVSQIGGIVFDLQDFVRSDDEGELCVTTACLRGYLDRLAIHAERFSERERMQKQQLVKNCLRTVFGFFDLYWDAPVQFDRWRVSSVLSLDTLMSIMILGETFKNAAAQIWPLPAGVPSPMRQVYNFRPQNPLQERLHERGWCPNEGVMLFKELDSTGLHLASLVQRPFSRGLRHERCTDDLCLALQTSDDDYQTKHADSCPQDSSCVDVDVGQENVSSILYSGGIPIIYVPFFPEDDVPLKVEIRPYKSDGIEYIAFSHVWAHGMGNPKANALPSCQILRLKELSAKSSSSPFRQPAFWIDTLCIPVGSKHKPARKLAITRIAETYRQARRVLVLDADLQRCSRFRSRTELATRVLCCGWMRRLWTLQEAVMSEKAANAGKLDVQFLEGALEFNAIAGKSVGNLHHTEKAIQSIFSAFPQFRTRDRTYAFLSRALKHRTTSKKEDEALCLAPILGFDQGQIAAIVNESTAETRMQMMYTLMGDIPASVLFNKLAKLGHQCFRWAPASLLGLQDSPDLSNHVVAKCDASGLHVQFSGFVVTKPQKERQMVQKGHAERIFIGSAQDPSPKFIATPKPVYDSRLVYLNSRAFENSIKETPTPAFILNPQDANESAFVSVTLETNSIIHAVYLDSCQMKSWSSPSNYNAEVYGDWRDHLMDVREVASDQKWCIR